MRIVVRVFARLRDVVGSGDVSVDVVEPATIADVWAALERRYPDVAPFRASLSAARNDDYARMHEPVGAGDEVAFLPPVSGGASMRRRT